MSEQSDNPTPLSLKDIKLEDPAPSVPFDVKPVLVEPQEKPGELMAVKEERELIANLSDEERQKYIAEELKKVFVQAGEIAEKVGKSDPEYKESYHQIVDTALTRGWLDGTESPEIKARSEALKQKEEKAISQSEELILKINALPENYTNISQLNGIRSGLTSIDTDGLRKEIKNKVESAIKKIDQKIEAILQKKQQEEENKSKNENKPKPGLLGSLFGQKVA